MSDNAVDNENTSKLAPATAKPKGARKAGKKAKPPKKPGRVKNPKTDRANKKAKVDRDDEAGQGGATLAEIMKTTGWQVQRRPHSAKPHVGFEEPAGSATPFLRTIQ